MKITLIANGRKEIPKGSVKIIVQERKEKKEDAEDAGEIYEAGRAIIPKPINEKRKRKIIISLKLFSYFE